jgi:hypothetical protein
MKFLASLIAAAALNVPILTASAADSAASTLEERTLVNSALQPFR